MLVWAKIREKKFYMLDDRVQVYHNLALCENMGIVLMWC